MAEALWRDATVSTRPAEGAREGEPAAAARGTLSRQTGDLTYAQARGYEQADMERLGTRDTSRRGLPFEPGEANRCNFFDTARCEARAQEFNKYREERLRALGCCRS